MDGILLRTIALQLSSGCRQAVVSPAPELVSQSCPKKSIALRRRHVVLQYLVFFLKKINSIRVSDFNTNRVFAIFISLLAVVGFLNLNTIINDDL